LESIAEAIAAAPKLKIDMAASYYFLDSILPLRQVNVFLPFDRISLSDLINLKFESTLDVTKELIVD
jgi:hypothetical protein